MAIARQAHLPVHELKLRSNPITEHRRDTVLILDFGGQYCHLIARSVRELNVYSEIVNPNVSAKEIRELQKQSNIKGIILSGGPQSVYGTDSQSIDPKILDLNIPILGLCYGHQLIAHLARGDVQPGSKKEFGDTTVVIDKPSQIQNSLT